MTRTTPRWSTALAEAPGPAIDWLAERFGLPFSVVTDFDYPGHSAPPHARPAQPLGARADRPPARHVRGAKASTSSATAGPTVLYHDGARITGVERAPPRWRDRDDRLRPPDPGLQRLWRQSRAGQRTHARHRRARSSSAMTATGRRDDWGDALGAATRHLGAYQGHGNVAHPHGILITWAMITEGGVQVNRTASGSGTNPRAIPRPRARCWRSPAAMAFAIFDARIAAIARQFEDFQARRGARCCPKPPTRSTSWRRSWACRRHDSRRRWN